jgi:hypothetical protein
MDFLSPISSGKGLADRAAPALLLWQPLPRFLLWQRARALTLTQEPRVGALKALSVFWSDL